ncbi:MAG TPA: hypothetical protein DF409_03340 [Bacteroidales bacterium]|nr:hypothetical protein [Bacteroidales bacterium]
MERMNNNLALLKKNMDNMTIKSPVDGKLSSFLVEIGQTKVSGEHLGQIAMMDGIKLRANIDERYISRVFTGQEASCDIGNKTFELEISKIYTNVSGGTFQVDLLFKDEEPAEVKRGQTIQLKVKFSGASDALILRRGGFFQETGGNWIYVLDPSEQYAVKRSIRIGRQNATHYEVLEGLEAGEKVIVSSYSNFNSREKLIFRK